MRFCVVFGVLLLVSALNASAGELSSGGEQVWVCGTPGFHESAKFLAEKFELKVLPPAELKRIGKMSPMGGILEENVSDVRTFYSLNSDTNKQEVAINATLRNKTANVYVYVELKEPGGNDVWYNGSNNGYVTQADVNEITKAFDDALSDGDIYGRDRLYFGEERPTGVDGDSHVTILLLDIDADQSSGYSGGVYTGGYYWSLNEYSDAIVFPSGYGHSNQRKIILIDTFPSIDYKSGSTLWVPDRFHTASGEGANNTFGTLAHEFQHMIHWYHDSDEETWVDEGCADYAQYVNGLGHPESHVLYFENSPDTTLTNWSGTLQNYGASYLWTLYLSEHYGGNQTVKALVNNTAHGIAGVNSTLSQRGYNASFQQIFPRWVVANVVDDTNFSSGEYGYDSINLNMGFAASKSSYPASGADSVNAYAGDYILFYNGNGSSLNVSFDGADSTAFAVYAAEANSTNTLAVSGMSLDSAKRGSLGISSFASGVKNVALVVVGRDTGGSYSYAAEYIAGEVVTTTTTTTTTSTTTTTTTSTTSTTSTTTTTTTVPGATTTTTTTTTTMPLPGTTTVPSTTTLEGTTTMPSTTTIPAGGATTIPSTTTLAGTTTVPGTTTLPTTTTSSTSTTTITHVTQNITEDIPANSSTEINASDVNVTIAVVTSSNVSQASINVTAYAGNPTNASLGVTALNKYYDIEASQPLKDALENILLRLHYTQAEVDAAGLDESKLAIYWLNESIGAWQKLDNNTMSWVYGTGVNATDDFAWANLTHFSLYAIGAGTQSQEIALITGWNLISLPLNLQ